MNMPEMIEIMRAEGLDYGEQIANDLFPDRISATWPDTVADIYNLEAMRAGFAAQFGEALGDTDIDVLIAFYEPHLPSPKKPRAWPWLNNSWTPMTLWKPMLWGR